MNSRIFSFRNILILLVAFLAKPVLASQFFGVTDVSIEGQRLDFEDWITDNLQKTYTKLLPNETIHVQAKISLHANPPRISSVNLGKLNAFSPVVTELPQAPRALIHRVKTIQFFITVKENTKSETKSSLIKIAEQSVPLINKEQIQVDILTVGPGAVTVRDIWHNLKWPLTAIFMVFLFSYTLMRISGLKWPHWRDLAKEMVFSLRNAVDTHQKIVKVPPQLREDFYNYVKSSPKSATIDISEQFLNEALDPVAFADESTFTKEDVPTFNLSIDPHHEVRDYIHHLGLNEIATLVKTQPDMGVQAAWLLNPEQREKLFQFVGSEVSAQLSQKALTHQDIFLNVTILKEALSVIRAGLVNVDTDGAENSWLGQMSASEEKAFYQKLIQSGKQSKALQMGKENLPVELCYELSPEILKDVFSELSLSTKSFIIASLSDKEAAYFIAKAVEPGTKMDRMLQDEVREIKKTHTHDLHKAAYDSHKRFVQACRAYLSRHPLENAKLQSAVTDWVKSISRGFSNVA
jgi:hypothetical protein